jgi:hypothetical protein
VAPVHADAQVVLVVAEPDVAPRLVLLDERGLEEQRLVLALGADLSLSVRITSTSATEERSDFIRGRSAGPSPVK